MFVGYSDSLRANPTNFPTPWAGSPSVVFEGCTPNCTFDAGAVRLVNNAPIAVTVDSVVVKVSTCTFDIWPHNTVLQQPGQQLIVTQTATVATAVCGGTSGADSGHRPGGDRERRNRRAAVRHRYQRSDHGGHVVRQGGHVRRPGYLDRAASVQDATIGVLGLQVIKVGLIQSTSTTDCTGSSGDAVVGSISVGGIPVNVNVHPGPNTTVSVLGVTLILNEQTPVPGADQGLTVNALHIKALGLLDVVLASSTSDTHNC